MRVKGVLSKAVFVIGRGAVRCVEIRDSADEALLNCVRTRAEQEGNKDNRDQRR